MRIGRIGSHHHCHPYRAHQQIVVKWLESQVFHLQQKFCRMQQVRRHIIQLACKMYNHTASLACTALGLGVTAQLLAFEVREENSSNLISVDRFWAAAASAHHCWCSSSSSCDGSGTQLRSELGWSAWGWLWSDMCYSLSWINNNQDLIGCFHAYHWLAKLHFVVLSLPSTQYRLIKIKWDVQGMIIFVSLAS